MENVNVKIVLKDKEISFLCNESEDLVSKIQKMIEQTKLTRIRENEFKKD